MEILVSVVCLAYNHEKYIRDTLEGFIMQKTSFDFEVIIHEDASTDKTADIIREYEAKHPAIIKPLYQKENIYSKGINCLQFIYPKMKGKYIAFCEGDDYWTDPLKLQKQVDFLEAHPDYVYSCHRFSVLEENTGQMYLSHNQYFDRYSEDERFSFDMNYPFQKEWITQTLTSVMRKDAIDQNYHKYFKYYRDFHLIYDVLSKGKAICHAFNGGVRREHDGGVYAHFPEHIRLLINYNVCKEFYQVERKRTFIIPIVLMYIKLRGYRKEMKVENLPFWWLRCCALMIIPMHYLKRGLKYFLKQRKKIKLKWKDSED